MQLRCGHRIITDGCKICTDLQSEWYKKLAKSGFEDAEDYRFLGEKNKVRTKSLRMYNDRNGKTQTSIFETVDMNRPLKRWHNNILNSVTTIEVELTLEKYERARDLLNWFKFETEMHKRIWELHCDGLSRGAIEKALAHLKGAYKQSQIRTIIKNLERENHNGDQYQEVC